MPDNLWLVLGLLGLSAATTLAANWAVGRLWKRPRLSLGSVLASLVWMLLLFAAGVLAVRYFERFPNAGLVALAGVALGLVAFALSLGRAVLFLRVQETGKPTLDRQELLTRALHHATYLLLALSAYLGLSWLLHRSVQPIWFVPLAAGALLAEVGRRPEWRTPASAVLVALVTAPLIPLGGVGAWWPLPLGFLCRLAVDLLRPPGVMLLWPLRRTRFTLFDAPLRAPGDATERRLVGGLVVVAAVLLVAVNWGPQPPPAPAAPTFQQTLDQYRAWQGRYLVVAQVEGVWQATGRRVNDRFEVLSAAGSSFILRDGYTGRVFSAGRAAGDNLYLQRVTVQAGEPVRVKATEVELRDQSLAEALPVLYEMQREPGLRHIYVSGDLLLARGEPELPVDYSQTQVRRVERVEAGRYRLSYVTAAGLIELADVRVEVANLVVVATYLPAGPTATPLPSPPARLEARP